MIANEGQTDQDALARDLQLYRTLFEMAPVGLGIADLEGNLIAYNEAMMRPGGYTRDDIAKIRNVARLYADPEQRVRALELATKQGFLVSHQVKFLRKDGTSYDALLSLTPVKIGGKSYWQAAVEDITTRCRLEEQLQQAQKLEAVGRLAGGVAHDFNNLLTAILGNITLLIGGMHARDPQREQLEQVERAARRAAELTKKLLGFSRRAMLSLEPVDLRAIARETAEILRRTLDPRIRLEIEEPSSLPLVLADPGEMNHVLMNLCLNARDAMREGGRLTICTSACTVVPAEPIAGFDGGPQDMVRLSVSDSGEGIPENLRARIFEPFFTTKAPGVGTGLGLAMVFGIVKQHRGWIDCTSEVGRGTRFDIYLPRHGDGVVEPARERREPEPAAGRETILFVDDEEPLRRLGRAILERYGYRVLLAADGVEALNVYAGSEGSIDLVILDVRMPRLTGRETLIELSRIDPAARVLLSTGYSCDELPVDGDIVVGVIQKPYRADDLARLVRKVLDER